MSQQGIPIARSEKKHLPDALCVAQRDEFYFHVPLEFFQRWCQGPDWNLRLIINYVEALLDNDGQPPATFASANHVPQVGSLAIGTTLQRSKPIDMRVDEFVRLSRTKTASEIITYAFKLLQLETTTNHKAMWEEVWGQRKALFA